MITLTPFPPDPRDTPTAGRSELLELADAIKKDKATVVFSTQPLSYISNYVRNADLCIAALRRSAGV